jgi:hypothetical protein
MSGMQVVLAGLAGLAAGAVNALAGGGTLITFPTLTALGIPAIAANVTNTVALCPGYLGATFAQGRDLRGQRARLLVLLPVGAVGGIVGGLLLLHTGERLFRSLVPLLVLLASGLIAAQERVRRWLAGRATVEGGRAASVRRVVLPVGVAAIYGGYFGAGLSVIVLAVLGLALDDSLTRLNAVKQAVAFSVNIAAAVFFLFSGPVVWPLALVVAAGALAGGAAGGHLAGRVRPGTLRAVIVVIGLVVAAIFAFREFR